MSELQQVLKELQLLRAEVRSMSRAVENDSKWIMGPEAQKISGLSQKTLWNLGSKGTINAGKKGKYWQVERASLFKYIGKEA